MAPEKSAALQRFQALLEARCKRQPYSRALRDIRKEWENLVAELGKG